MLYVIAKNLRKYPKLKKLLKYLYRLASYILYLNSPRFISKYQLLEYSAISWFGYFDKSPFSKDGSKILSHKFNGRCRVGYFEIETGEYIAFDETVAFNFQQGSRLMYLNCDAIIFNTIYDGKLIAKIHYMDGSAKLLRNPVYELIDDNNFLTINFNNLSRYSQDYSYFSLAELGYCDDDPYIGKCSVEGGFVKIVTLADLKAFDDDNSINRYHTVNHLLASPLKTGFVFINRFFVNGCRFDRLFYYDLINAKLVLLPTGDMVSHYCWTDDKKLFVFMNGDEGDGFYMVDLSSLCVEFIHALRGYRDGHPYFFKGNIVFDSYPDRKSYQTLYSYNIQSQQVDVIGKFRSRPTFEPYNRCDLHPRVSNQGDISFDSNHNGIRQTYVLRGFF